MNNVQIQNDQAQTFLDGVRKMDAVQFEAFGAMMEALSAGKPYEECDSAMNEVLLKYGRPAIRPSTDGDSESVPANVKSTGIIFDFTKLGAIIAERRMFDRIARELDISEAALTYKLSNQSEFTVREIDRLQEILAIPPMQVDKIFFAIKN